MDGDSQATKEALPHTPVTVSIKNPHCDKERFASHLSAWLLGETFQYRLK